jgi:hypothetical protein
MGGFYTNYTLRGPSQRAVAAALTGRRALVAPSHNNCVVAFDDASDDQDQERMATLAARLSGELACPVLVVLNHDDDILWYRLYLSGQLADEYDSSPGYFDPSAAPSNPAGGDAKQLCAAFGASDVAAVERILRKSSYDDDGYVFARERHADLARALALPGFTVGVAYASFEQEEYPEGLSAVDMLRSADAPAPPTTEEKQRQRDLEFYERLGAEDLSRKCKRDGCSRGAVQQSVLCRRHHFEMIQRRNCPFDH